MAWRPRAAFATALKPAPALTPASPTVLPTTSALPSPPPSPLSPTPSVEFLGSPPPPSSAPTSLANVLSLSTTLPSAGGCSERTAAAVARARISACADGCVISTPMPSTPIKKHKRRRFRLTQAKAHTTKRAHATEKSPSQLAIAFPPTTLANATAAAEEHLSELATTKRRKVSGTKTVPLASRPPAQWSEYVPDPVVMANNARTERVKVKPQAGIGGSFCTTQPPRYQLYYRQLPDGTLQPLTDEEFDALYMARMAHTSIPQ